MSLFAWITDPAILASLVTLTVMEIVLGIDNIIFISVIVARLPPEQAKRARQIGLALALVFRIALLSALFWLIGLTQPLFEIAGHELLVARPRAARWRTVPAGQGDGRDPQGCRGQ